jgi:hypothetical protein
MRVSARPGEKSSDQSRVVIWERAADDAVEYCDENGSKALCDRVWLSRSREFIIVESWYCGMRRSHTGMRSFHGGRMFVGMGVPPRRGGEPPPRHEWI